MIITFLTCAYKRPKILECFLNNFQSLKEQLAATIELKLVIAGDQKLDPECYALFQKYSNGATWVHSENLPLGKKWNTALKAIKNIPTDFVMIMGSDDLVDKNLIIKYVAIAKKSGVGYIGVRDMYFMNSATGDSTFWPGYRNRRIGEPIGCARMISKKVFERVAFQAWNNNLNKGLDASLTATLRKISVYPKVLSCKEDNIFVIDVKSETNIWGYKNFIREKTETKKLLRSYLPEPIVKQLEALKRV
jgi:hypothetical protein